MKTILTALALASTLALHAQGTATSRSAATEQVDAVQATAQALRSRLDLSEDQYTKLLSALRDDQRSRAQVAQARAEIQEGRNKALDENMDRAMLQILNEDQYAKWKASK